MREEFFMLFALFKNINDGMSRQNCECDFPSELARHFSDKKYLIKIIFSHNLIIVILKSNVT